jgi:hypothetical protein
VWLIVCGLLCGVVAYNGWRAAPAHAGTLFSFDFHSGGRGVRFFDIDAKNGNQDGDVPEASANLASGPVGYGLAAVAWPGPLASNAGSLILVLQPTAPSQINSLNYPIRAEARTGQNPSTATNSSVPGTTMTATAKSDIVESDAAVQNASSDAGTFGPSHVHSRTANAASAGRADATSLVQNLNFGAGAVKIDSVTSAAEAHSDGVKADGTAATTVQGMTVNGMPATVDQNGLHFGDQGQPVNKAVNDTAQQALAQSGITIVMSAPTKEVKGSSASVTAGSLIITWATGAGNPTFVWSIGGAEASVAAAAAPDEASSLIGTGPAGPTGGAVGALVDTSPGNVSPGGLGIASGEVGSGAPLTVSGNPADTPKGETAFSPAAAFTGKPTRFGWVFLAVLAALLVGLGLRRLTDDLLAERPATVCPLQDDSE